MDDRSRREEEERREAEQRRRREEPRPGAGGRHREELFDEELFGSLESGLGRSSRSRRVPPEDSSRVQDRETVLEPGDPGRGRRRSQARG